VQVYQLSEDLEVVRDFCCRPHWGRWLWNGGVAMVRCRLDGVGGVAGRDKPVRETFAGMRGLVAVMQSDGAFSGIGHCWWVTESLRRVIDLMGV
jgi:hypothetical protein